MVTLKVVSYYDAWLKEGKRVVLLEKDGSVYNASGLFVRLEDHEILNMENVEVLFQEDIDYNDKSIEEQVAFLNEIQRLEKMYNIQQFGGYKSKLHWIYMNGVSKIKSYG